MATHNAEGKELFVCGNCKCRRTAGEYDVDRHGHRRKGCIPCRIKREMGRGTYTALNDGLRKLGLTPSEVKIGYTYIGRSRESEFFMIPDQDRPTHVDKCVCGHKIIENRYLRSPDNGHTISMGNCCIKQFIDGGRACEDCGASHRNRRDNKCSDCRLPKCIVCKEKFHRKYGHHEKCEDCYRNPPSKPAADRARFYVAIEPTHHDPPSASATTKPIHRDRAVWAYQELYSTGSARCNKCTEILRACEPETCASCSSRYFKPASAL